MANNITFRSTDPWRSSVGRHFEQELINWILQNPDLFEKINQAQRAHYNLYTNYTDNGQIKSIIDSNNLTKQYQDMINRDFGFVNTKGIAQGIASNRYNAVSDPESGDNANRNWTADGLYGAYTDDRRILGRKGDYDMSTLEEMADRLEPSGLDIYLDPTTNYYMLRPIESGLNLLTGDDQNSGTGNRNKDWLSLYPKTKSSYPGWSDWIPLTTKKIVDDLATIRTGLLERQKKFPRFEAPQEYAKVTDAYALRLLLEQQKADVLHRAGFNHTSDLAQNMQTRAKGEEIAQQITDKQVDLKSREFQETSKLVQDVANKNNMYRTNVANLNIQSNVAAFNNILDSRIKQNERLAATAGTYIGDMYTNFGEYLKTKRLNENARKRQEAYDVFNKLKVAATKAFYDLQDHPESWNKLSEFATALQSADLQGLTSELQQIWQTAVASGNPYNDPAFVNMLVNILKTGNSAVALRYRAYYQQDLLRLLQAAEKNLLLSEDQLRAVLASIDTYATNQWGINWTSRKRRSVLSRKKGGTIDNTFTRLEAIRQREQKSVRDNTEKRNKRIQDSLDKQLDRVSKEELALLRAIFK